MRDALMKRDVRGRSLADRDLLGGDSYDLVQAGYRTEGFVVDDDALAGVRDFEGTRGADDFALTVKNRPSGRGTEVQHHEQRGDSESAAPGKPATKHAENIVPRGPGSSHALFVPMGRHFRAPWFGFSRTPVIVSAFFGRGEPGRPPWASR